eukprot:Protomagalhaensia_wolfi_Nauph_80__1526@NODE_192_length_3230_cov_101_865559_g145_i0_p2_GENE_NODE_192_length_3230_cov_101_865559_g145_i0NODE_192_length_3230_cov_101_865559_g145_i0_p2_ORF_typecomplete_len206_score15_44Ribo_biogen_C/PF04034_13/2_3e39RLI/PF04068_15/2_9e11RLI/PF04068_15/5e03_NODE_192_length_3230_cov_101_865559_g145_i013751992
MVRLAMWDFNQCDPARCSGRKLRKLGKLTELRKDQRFSGIILCAEATTTVSPCDRSYVEQRGICVIDCSWNRTNEIKLKKLTAGGIMRKLPFLRAANPCHYGRAFELNCAEAIAATLFITGYVEESIDIMSSFKWGHAFFSVNEESLDLYSEDGLTAREVDAISAKREKAKFVVRSVKELETDDEETSNETDDSDSDSDSDSCEK